MIISSETAAIAVKGLSFERLKTFCEVLEAGTIASAAEREPTRQSQYSRQIKELEEALGAPLFIREGRIWKLTERGRRLALVTHAYFKELGEISSRTGEGQETIRIAAGESVFDGLLIQKFGEIRKALPGVMIELINMTTAGLVESLRDGSADLGIGRDDAFSKEFKTQPLAVMEYRLVVPRSFLKEKMASGIELLKDLPIAIISGSGGYVRSLTHIADEHHISLRVAVRAQSFVLLQPLMISANLAGVVPYWIARRFPEDRFAALDLKELKNLSRTLVLAYHQKMDSMRPTFSKLASRIGSLLAETEQLLNHWHPGEPSCASLA